MHGHKKIIAIVGATGAQGGALLRAILALGDKSDYRARAITRNASSPKAMELKNLGAEVLEADVNNSDEFAKAIQGAYGLFCVTFFWDHHNPEKEMEQAKSMAEAAKKAGIKHVVWSTLEDTRKFIPLDNDSMPTLQGKYKVPHFDAKGESDKYFADLPTTYMMASFYWENLIFFGMGPKKGPDGKYHLTLPMGDKKMPGIAVDDIGRCALGIFNHPDLYMNKHVGIAGEHLTMAQMAAKMAKHLGKDIDYNKISFEAYRKLGFPGAEDLGNMFQFYHDFEDVFCKARSVEESRKLNSELMTFDRWLEKHGKQMIPID